MVSSTVGTHVATVVKDWPSISLTDLTSITADAKQEALAVAKKAAHSAGSVEVQKPNMTKEKLQVAIHDCVEEEVKLFVLSFARKAIKETFIRCCSASLCNDAAEEAARDATRLALAQVTGLSSAVVGSFMPMVTEKASSAALLAAKETGNTEIERSFACESFVRDKVVKAALSAAKTAAQAAVTQAVEKHNHQLAAARKAQLEAEEKARAEKAREAMEEKIRAAEEKARQEAAAAAAAAAAEEQKLDETKQAIIQEISLDIADATRAFYVKQASSDVLKRFPFDDSEYKAAVDFAKGKVSTVADDFNTTAFETLDSFKQTIRNASFALVKPDCEGYVKLLVEYHSNLLQQELLENGE